MKKLLILLFVLTCMQHAFSQSQKVYNVAIFLNDGVELLDFAGPGEVFGATQGFNAYTVGITTDPIISQGYVKVVPQYSIDDCPKPDIVFVGGGGTSKLLQSEAAMDWFREMSEQSEIMLSVCTGAFVFGKIGLLDGKKATTFYRAIENLRQATPKAEILDDVRFVDNGNVITTTGISAGIDGALHVVAKLKGFEAAKATVEYMQYDKWQPNEGLILKTPFAEKLHSEGVEAAIAAYAKQPENYTFYLGELLAMSDKFIAQNKHEEAEKLLKFGANTYPEYAIYAQLGEVLKARGAYAPPSKEELSALVDAGQLDKVKKAFHTAKAKYPDWVLWDEQDVNMAGYHMMHDKKYKEAIALFQLNVEAYPDSFNVYDSLAEAFMLSGNKELAVKNYKKSLELNPDNTNAVEMLKKLDVK